jgi:uncharacterized phiE125 gp8 family phage protein
VQQLLIQAPTVEPISIAGAKAHLRIDIDDEHDLIEGWIGMAREVAEGYTRRALVRQAWRVTYDRFPAVIELPVLPVRKVTAIQYVDSAGATQTLSAALYQVDRTTSDRSRIMPVYGEVWPHTQPKTFGAVTVDFIAGHTVPFTTDFASDVNALAAIAHPFEDDDVLQLWNLDGGLPAGLAVRTNYHVVNATADAFELAATQGGAPIMLTSDGTGAHFAGLIPGPIVSAMKLLIGHFDRNREETAATLMHRIPFGIESLMLPYTSIRY